MGAARCDCQQSHIFRETVSFPIPGFLDALAARLPIVHLQHHTAAAVPREANLAHSTEILLRTTKWAFGHYRAKVIKFRIHDQRLSGPSGAGEQLFGVLLRCILVRFGRLMVWLGAAMQSQIF